MLARFKTSHEVRRESECGPKMGLAGREPDIQQGGAPRGAQWLLVAREAHP